MGKVIGVWLLAKARWNPFKPMEYYCLQPSGAETKTTNKKLAMRWMRKADAEYAMVFLPEKYTPVLVMFDGDEPAYVQM